MIVVRATSCHSEEQWQATQVGPPVACNNIKLADVPDMEYFSARGQGEVFNMKNMSLRYKMYVWQVCVIGSNVFQGYFRSDLTFYP